MKKILHIINGDAAGDCLAKSGLAGEILVWRDVLYDGPRKPGWPDNETLWARACFLADGTNGGLDRQSVLKTLQAQYARLELVGNNEKVVLWFDACLFDQAMLCHLLACMMERGWTEADLILIDAFPGIEPYHGLGQLTPDQLASFYDRRQPLTTEQYVFARRVDRAFASQDRTEFHELAKLDKAPLPWVPAAMGRWMEERPDRATGLGRLEQLALEAIKAGCETPAGIFLSASARERPPQFWGDVTLWQKINALAEREPPLVRIEGPGNRLPQWGGAQELELFRIYPL